MKKEGDQRPKKRHIGETQFKNKEEIPKVERRLKRTEKEDEKYWYWEARLKETKDERPEEETHREKERGNLRARREYRRRGEGN